MSDVELDEVPAVSRDGSVELELNLNGGFGDESYVRSLCHKHQPHALAERPCLSFSNDRGLARLKQSHPPSEQPLVFYLGLIITCLSYSFLQTLQTSPNC
jgi:hypothetical protein